MRTQLQLASGAAARWRYGILALLLVGLVGRSYATEPLLIRAELRGELNPVKAAYIEQTLDYAARRQASAVLLSIDTTGGQLDSLQQIALHISDAQVPVIGLVEPRGAAAVGAAALILLATDIAAMLPDTRFGVEEGSSQYLADGAKSALAAQARTEALRRGRAADVAEDMVRNSRSYTAQEAKDRRLIEFLVQDEHELLVKLDGRVLNFPDRKLKLDTRHLMREERALSWQSQLRDMTADPTIAMLLLSIGVLAMFYEFVAPGIALGGAVGVICCALGIWFMLVLPTRPAGFVLLGLGLAAIGVEVFVSTRGLLPIAGLGGLGIAALVVVDESRYFGAAPRVDLRWYLPVMAALALGLLLMAAAARKARRAAAPAGREVLRGMEGVAKTRFFSAEVGYIGSAFVNGVMWQAVADDRLVEGDALVVVEVLRQPSRLRVKRCARP